MKKLRRKEIYSHEARQRLSRAGLFAGTQPAFRAGGRQSGGLSPSRAARCRTGPVFRVESERTISDRLGGARTTTGFSSSSRRAGALRASSGQSIGVRRAVRQDRHRVSRPRAAREGVCRHTRKLECGRSSGPAQQFRRFGQETEVGAASEPSVAMKATRPKRWRSAVQGGRPQPEPLLAWPSAAP